MRTCFVICPIGNEGSDTRKQSDDVFEFLISPVVKELGYNPITAAQISTPGIVTNQIIEQLVDAELVIADLTGFNPNVMYELAIRHMTKKPCISIIKKGGTLPFDISPDRTIFYDLDLRGVKEAIEELSKNINSIHSSKFETNNPISIAMDLKALKNSGKTTDKNILDIFNSLSGIRSEITTLNKEFRRATFGNIIDSDTIFNEPPSSIPALYVDSIRGILTEIESNLKKNDNIKFDVESILQELLISKEKRLNFFQSGPLEGMDPGLQALYVAGLRHDISLINELLHT